MNKGELNLPQNDIVKEAIENEKRQESPKEAQNDAPPTQQDLEDQWVKYTDEQTIDVSDWDEPDMEIEI